MALYNTQGDNPNAAALYYYEQSAPITGTYQVGTSVGISLYAFSVIFVTSATVGNRRIAFRVTNLVLGQIFFIAQSPIYQAENLTYTYIFQPGAVDSWTGNYITIGIPRFKWIEPLYLTILDMEGIASVSDTVKIAYCGEYIENSRRV